MFDGASSRWLLLRDSSTLVTLSSSSSNNVPVMPFVSESSSLIDFRMPTLKQFAILRALNDTALTTTAATQNNNNSDSEIDISAVTVGTIDRFDRVLVNKLILFKLIICVHFVLRASN